MKKQILGALLLSLIFGAAGMAQNFQDIVGIEESCDPDLSPGDNEEAELIVDQFMSQMALSRSFRIQRCPQSKNAEAKLVKDEDGNLIQYLLYDPEWLSQLSDKSATNWAAIGVLAHEVGHFLLSHSLNNKGSNPRWELEADTFLGGVLARMGSTLEQAKSCFIDAPVNGSSTHPPREARLEAITTGWERVNNLSQQRVIVNQFTPHEDVTSEGLITRYFKELGGTENIKKVLQLRYNEHIVESRINNREREVFDEFTYAYEQYAPTTIMVSWDNPTGYKEQYLIQNDSLRFKYIDETNWRKGAPPNGTADPDDDDLFMEEIHPKTVEFFDQLILLSNPDFANYEGPETFEDYLFNEEVPPEECWVLEMPRKTLTVGNPPRKGKVIEIFRKNFYSIETGLLFGIIEERRITTYSKGGRQRDNLTVTKKTALSDYRNMEGVRFPFKFYQLSYETDDGFPVEGTALLQEREVADFEINPDLNLEDVQM